MFPVAFDKFKMYTNIEEIVLENLKKTAPEIYQHRRSKIVEKHCKLVYEQFYENENKRQKVFYYGLVLKPMPKSFREKIMQWPENGGASGSCSTTHKPTEKTLNDQSIKKKSVEEVPSCGTSKVRNDHSNKPIAKKSNHPLKEKSERDHPPVHKLAAKTRNSLQKENISKIQNKLPETDQPEITNFFAAISLKPKNNPECVEKQKVLKRKSDSPKTTRDVEPKSKRPKNFQHINLDNEQKNTKSKPESRQGKVLPKPTTNNRVKTDSKKPKPKCKQKKSSEDLRSDDSIIETSDIELDPIVPTSKAKTLYEKTFPNRKKPKPKSCQKKSSDDPKRDDAIIQTSDVVLEPIDSDSKAKSPDEKQLSNSKTPEPKSQQKKSSDDPNSNDAIIQTSSIAPHPIALISKVKSPMEIKLPNNKKPTTRVTMIQISDIAPHPIAPISTLKSPIETKLPKSKKSEPKSRQIISSDETSSEIIGVELDPLDLNGAVDSPIHTKIRHRIISSNSSNIPHNKSNLTDDSTTSKNGPGNRSSRSQAKSPLPKRNRNEDYRKPFIEKLNQEEQTSATLCFPDHILQKPQRISKKDIEMWIENGQKAFAEASNETDLEQRKPNSFSKEIIKKVEKLRAFNSYPEEVQRYIKYLSRMEIVKGKNREVTNKPSKTYIETALSQITYEEYKQLIDAEKLISNRLSAGECIESIENYLKKFYYLYIKKRNNWPTESHIKLSKLEAFLHSKGLGVGIQLKDIPPAILSFEEVLEKSNIKEYTSLSCPKPPESYKNLLVLVKKTYNDCCAAGVWNKGIKLIDKANGEKESQSSMENSIQLFSASMSMAPLEVTPSDVETNVQAPIEQHGDEINCDVTRIDASFELHNKCDRSNEPKTDRENNDGKQLEKNLNKSIEKSVQSGEMVPAAPMSTLELEHVLTRTQDLHTQPSQRAEKNYQQSVQSKINTSEMFENQASNETKSQSTPNLVKTNLNRTVQCIETIPTTPMSTLELLRVLTTTQDLQTQSSKQNEENYQSTTNQVKTNLNRPIEKSLPCNEIIPTTPMSTLELQRVLTRTQDLQTQSSTQNEENYQLPEVLENATLKGIKPQSTTNQVKTNLNRPIEQSVQSIEAIPTTPMSTLELQRVLTRTQDLQTQSSTQNAVSYQQPEVLENAQSTTNEVTTNLNRAIAQCIETMPSTPMSTLELERVLTRTQDSQTKPSLQTEENYEQPVQSEINKVLVNSTLKGTKLQPKANQVNQKERKLETTSKEIQIPPSPNLFPYSSESDQNLPTQDVTNLGILANEASKVISEKQPLLNSNTKETLTLSPNLFQSSGESDSKCSAPRQQEVQFPETVYVSCDRSINLNTEEFNYSVQKIEQASQNQDPFSDTILEKEDSNLLEKQLPIDHQLTRMIEQTNFTQQTAHARREEETQSEFNAPEERNLTHQTEETNAPSGSRISARVDVKQEIFSQYDDDVEIIDKFQSEPMLIDDEETAPELIDMLLSGPTKDNRSKPLIGSLSHLATTSSYFENFPQAQQMPSNFNLTQTDSLVDQSSNVQNQRTPSTHTDAKNDKNTAVEKIGQVVSEITKRKLNKKKDDILNKPPQDQNTKPSDSKSLDLSKTSLPNAGEDKGNKLLSNLHTLIDNRGSSEEKPIDESSEEFGHISIQPQNIPSDIELTQSSSNHSKPPSQDDSNKLVQLSGENGLANDCSSSLVTHDGHVENSDQRSTLTQKGNESDLNHENNLLICINQKDDVSKVVKESEQPNGKRNEKRKDIITSNPISIQDAVDKTKSVEMSRQISKTTNASTSVCEQGWFSGAGHELYIESVLTELLEDRQADQIQTLPKETCENTNDFCEFIENTISNSNHCPIDLKTEVSSSGSEDFDAIYVTDNESDEYNIEGLRPPTQRKGKSISEEISKEVNSTKHPKNESMTNELVTEVNKIQASVSQLTSNAVVPVNADSLGTIFIKTHTNLANMAVKKSNELETDKEIKSERFVCNEDPLYPTSISIVSLSTCEGNLVICDSVNEEPKNEGFGTQEFEVMEVNPLDDMETQTIDSITLDEYLLKDQTRNDISAKEIKNEYANNESENDGVIVLDITSNELQENASLTECLSDREDNFENKNARSEESPPIKSFHENFMVIKNAVSLDKGNPLIKEVAKVGESSNSKVESERENKRRNEITIQSEIEKNAVIETNDKNVQEIPTSNVNLQRRRHMIESKERAVNDRVQNVVESPALLIQKESKQSAENDLRQASEQTTHSETKDTNRNSGEKGKNELSCSDSEHTAKDLDSSVELIESSDDDDDHDTALSIPDKSHSCLSDTKNTDTNDFASFKAHLPTENTKRGKNPTDKSLQSLEKNPEKISAESQAYFESHQETEDATSSNYAITSTQLEHPVSITNIENIITNDNQPEDDSVELVEMSTICEGPVDEISDVGPISSVKIDMIELEAKLKKSQEEQSKNTTESLRSKEYSKKLIEHLECPRNLPVNSIENEKERNSKSCPSDDSVNVSEKNVAKEVDSLENIDDKEDLEDLPDAQRSPKLVARDLDDTTTCVGGAKSKDAADLTSVCSEEIQDSNPTDPIENTKPNETILPEVALCDINADANETSDVELLETSDCMDSAETVKELQSNSKTNLNNINSPLKEVSIAQNEQLASNCEDSELVKIQKETQGNLVTSSLVVQQSAQAEVMVQSFFGKQRMSCNTDPSIEIQSIKCINTKHVSTQDVELLPELVSQKTTKEVEDVKNKKSKNPKDLRRAVEKASKLIFHGNRRTFRRSMSEEVNSLHSLKNIRSRNDVIFNNEPIRENPPGALQTPSKTSPLIESNATINTPPNVVLCQQQLNSTQLNTFTVQALIQLAALQSSTNQVPIETSTVAEEGNPNDLVEVPLLVERRFLKSLPFQVHMREISKDSTIYAMNVNMDIKPKKNLHSEEQKSLQQRELYSPTIPRIQHDEKTVCKLVEKTFKTIPENIDCIDSVTKDTANCTEPVIVEKPIADPPKKSKSKPCPASKKKKPSPTKLAKITDFVPQKTHAFSSLPLIAGKKPASYKNRQQTNPLQIEECDFLIEDASQVATTASQMLGTDCTYFENSELLRNLDGVPPVQSETPALKEHHPSLPSKEKVINLNPVILSEGVTARKVWQVNLQWKSAKKMSIEVRLSVNKHSMTVCDESAKLLFNFTPEIWSHVCRILREIDHFEYKRIALKNQKVKPSPLHKVLRMLFDSASQVVNVRMINDSFSPFTMCEKVKPVYRKPLQCLTKGIPSNILNRMKALKENLQNNNLEEQI